MIRHNKSYKHQSTNTHKSNSSSWALETGYMGIRNSSYQTEQYKAAINVKEDETNFVSTDSHRLVVYKRTDLINPEPIEFIMPKKPLAIFKNILANSNEDVTIEFNENMAKFTFGNNTWICRLIDGKYPNYTAVIPKENPNVFYQFLYA